MEYLKVKTESMKKESEKLKAEVRNLTSKEETSEATVRVNNEYMTEMNIIYRGKHRRKIKFFQTNS